VIGTEWPPGQPAALITQTRGSDTDFILMDKHGLLNTITLSGTSFEFDHIPYRLQLRNGKVLYFTLSQNKGYVIDPAAGTAIPLYFTRDKFFKIRSIYELDDGRILGLFTNHLLEIKTVQLYGPVGQKTVQE
jgi:hypothetical protein